MELGWSSSLSNFTAFKWITAQSMMMVMKCIFSRSINFNCAILVDSISLSCRRINSSRCRPSAAARLKNDKLFIENQEQTEMPLLYKRIISICHVDYIGRSNFNADSNQLIFSRASDSAVAVVVRCDSVNLLKAIKCHGMFTRCLRGFVTQNGNSAFRMR